MGQALRRLFDAFFSTKEMRVTRPLSLPFLVLSVSRRFFKLLDKGVHDRTWQWDRFLL
jgi:hypothetical protein